jgi:UDPglucose 6-dehydrogenase
VGLANAVLLAQHNDVAAVDIDAERVAKINARQSPLDEELMSEYLAKPLKLAATTDAEAAYGSAELVVVAVPTDYDDSKGAFDMATADAVIGQIRAANRSAAIAIRSTVPVGYTAAAAERHGNVMFAPEFLREGKALRDSLDPSRIIVGLPPGSGAQLRAQAEAFAGELRRGSLKQDAAVMYMGASEAECVKLFANSYLAMRVAFFNELDTYAERRGYSAEQIIKGVGLDPRIGDHFNNPSFGYGGYCFPKDTKQLECEFKGVPGSLAGAIVRSNSIRKKHIAEQLRASCSGTIGIYRLAMKTGSDNFRGAAALGVAAELQSSGREIVVYEPLCQGGSYEGMRIIRTFEEFAETADIIAANRSSGELEGVKGKVYTRDAFGRD